MDAPKSILIVEKVCKCLSQNSCELYMEGHVTVELIVLGHVYPQ